MKQSNPQFKLGFISAAVALLAACGGGGSGGSAGLDGDDAPSAVPTTPVTTTVMDGLIKWATVCVDSNSNGLCESTELQRQTDANGRVTLNIPTASLARAKLIAVIKAGESIDADTGVVTSSYTMKSSAGKTAVISPLTHMVQTKMEADAAQGSATTLAAAESYVQSQTGVTVPLFDNFIEKRDTDEHYKNAGLVARLLVVNTQKLKSPDELVHRLSEIKSKAKEVKDLPCAAGNLIIDCDDDIHTNTLSEQTPTSAPTAAPTSAPNAVAQTITFALPGTQTMGAAPSALSATSPSGLAVALTTSTPSVCTVSGSALTLVSAGSCTITANQAGNTGYAAAAAIARTFTVSPAAVVVVTSAANGKVLYATNSVMSCAGCHGKVPSMQNVLKGANSPNTILNAINSNAGGMGIYIGKFSTQQLTDIAAYLATPNL